MEKYEFVEERNIAFRFDLMDADPERIYHHFMNEDDEICLPNTTIEYLHGKKESK